LYLSHELVLVAVHARELSNVGKGVLKTVSKLVGVHVAEAVLDVGVDNELCKSKDFAAQMDCQKKKKKALFSAEKNT